MKIQLYNGLYDILSIRFFSRINTKYKGQEYPWAGTPIEWYDEYVVECRNGDNTENWNRKLVMTLPSIKKEVILDDNEELRIDLEVI